MNSPIYVYYTPLEKYNIITTFLRNHEVVYIGNGSFPYPLTMEYISENEFYNNYIKYINKICFFDFIPNRENLRFISMIEQSHIFGTKLVHETKFPVLTSNDIIDKVPTWFIDRVECNICFNIGNKYNLKCCSLIICIDCAEKSNNKCPQCRRYFSLNMDYLANKTYPDYLYTGKLFFYKPEDYKNVKSQINYFYPNATLVFSVP